MNTIAARAVEFSGETLELNRLRMGRVPPSPRRRTSISQRPASDDDSTILQRPAQRSNGPAQISATDSGAVVDQGSDLLARRRTSLLQNPASDDDDSTTLGRPAQSSNGPAQISAADSRAAIDQGSNNHAPLLRVPLTLFRLTIILATLILVTAKLVLTLFGSNMAVNTLDFVLAAVIGLGWWGGLYEVIEPPIWIWYFHRDYSHEVLRMISSTTVAVVQTAVELFLVLPLLLNSNAALKHYLESSQKGRPWGGFLTFLLASIMAFIALSITLFLFETVLRKLKLIDTNAWVAIKNDTHLVTETLAALIHPKFRYTMLAP
ncbi:hypothetical protein GALMADRAFT_1147166 [Galerina marginata CBS 339.88]|uniref:Uncharacterized protein n=1 Tax=Galerina marginata (strain CBS 339.88) TaxID=685588 RepID=A0A067S6W7_GALM3|nr:hypothetical protein GALMADRAFT_1147166 [Galerina marginata CBS 339.88]